MDEPAKKPEDELEAESPVWSHLRDSLRGLRFGTVTLIVQDGIVIQIDRTEKKRLQRKA